MGFLKQDQGSGAEPQTGSGHMSPDDKFAKHTNGPNFGQRLMQFEGARHPAMGALMDQVFGQQPQPQEISKTDPQYGFGTPPPFPEGVVGMNAQPKQGGGLATLLKMFAG